MNNKIFQPTSLHRKSRSRKQQSEPSTITITTIDESYPTHSRLVWGSAGAPHGGSVDGGAGALQVTHLRAPPLPPTTPNPPAASTRRRWRSLTIRLRRGQTTPLCPSAHTAMLCVCNGGLCRGCVWCGGVHGRRPRFANVELIPVGTAPLLLCTCTSTCVELGDYSTLRFLWYARL